jgi:hypothetical protein
LFVHSLFEPSQKGPNISDKVAFGNHPYLDTFSSRCSLHCRLIPERVKVDEGTCSTIEVNRNALDRNAGREPLSIE